MKKEQAKVPDATGQTVGDAPLSGAGSRDPRVDPRVGDVVKRKGELRAFTIERIWPDGSISGRFQGGRYGGSLCGVSYWRTTFAKGAEVIHCA